MSIIDKVNDAVRIRVRSWLKLEETSPTMIQINETVDYEINAIRNRIWYRGDSNELEQLYEQMQEYADKYKFWAGKPTPGMEIRKMHTGVPGLIVKTLASVVMADMNDFEIKDAKQAKIWAEIEKDNKFRKMLGNALKGLLFIGDGAFKVSFDSTVSEYPILEFYTGERIEIVYERGRVKEIIFKTVYTEHKRRYILHEHYGYGYVTYELYRDIDGAQVDLTRVKATENLENVKFDKSLMLAVPILIYESNKWEGRGQSLFDGKIDSFDAFDEAWSQWMDALRAGRSKTYIPDCLIPRDPKSGELIKPNAFDNRFIKIDNNLKEAGDNKIDTEQPDIPHDSYMSTYITALDLCLQGIISPSTLGIDVKKLDNAEAQREKEKATLYTRNAIVEALQETLPCVVSVCINAFKTLLGQSLEDVTVDIPFGEYANPSFESQIETVGKGRTQGILSIEACVEELYGDSKDDEWKNEEINRLKAEQGLLELDEPSVTGNDIKQIDSTANSVDGE